MSSRAMQMRLGFQQSSLEIPYAFIDHYLTGCAPVYPLVYIYSLRRLLGGEPVTTQEIAAHFGLLVSDVENAWRHFEKVGLVQLEGEAPDFSITFLPVGEPEERAEKPALAIVKKQSTVEQTIEKPARPTYCKEELMAYRTQSNDIARLFDKAQQALGARLLPWTDLSIIFSFHDELRLPIDVIECLLNYCEENGHRNIKYMEKCAVDWSEKGIDDVEKALIYVQTFDKRYRSILKHMGKLSTHPTPAQRKMMDKWFDEFNLPLDVVLAACDQTTVSAEKPSLSYVNKILIKWHKNGIVTMEAVNQANAEFETQKEAAPAVKPAKSAPKPKPNRFINFQQRENDYSQIEKMEREYQLQRLKNR